jgi:sugar phosphate isomerase/epimerase
MNSDAIGWIACAGVILGNLFFVYLGAYLKEKGKRLATKEDVDSVVEQVRAVTRETELIKAEITGGLWQRQWHLAQKRDSYSRLIDALERIQVQRSAIREARDDLAVTEARRGEQDAIAEFRRARALARLMLSPKVVSGIGRLLRSIRQVDPSSSAEEEYAAAKRIVETARDTVVELGKWELGLDGPPSVAATKPS